MYEESGKQVKLTNPINASISQQVKTTTLLPKSAVSLNFNDEFQEKIHQEDASLSHQTTLSNVNDNQPTL